jgi:hypothetical protein
MILIETILGFIAEYIIVSFVCYVLSPIVWLVCLPFILIIALFRRGRYNAAVIDMLACVNSLWRWGIGLSN